MADTVVRTLHRADGWQLGAFNCGRGDRRWAVVNDIGDTAHVVFPRTSVVIAYLGQEPVLATPNHAMVYNPNQRFRRRLHDDRGDVCTFVSLLPEAVAGLGVELGEPELGLTKPLPFRHVPVDAATYLAHHLLLAELTIAPAPDPLAVEERVSALLLRTLSAGFTRTASSRKARRAAPAHRELVEAAKSELARTFTAQTSLAELGGRLHVSPFHLARIFRRHTGFTLHRYRLELRLRASLERLSDRSIGLTELALELGFASHSHFTDAFRRAFGVAPSTVRRRCPRGRDSSAPADLAAGSRFPGEGTEPSFLG